MLLVAPNYTIYLESVILTLWRYINHKELVSMVNKLAFRMEIG